MASNDTKTDAPREEQSKRQERANRILDAAYELLLRWGYRKTTVDDIARQAGVAKGTIYLHWKTRDDLFLALLIRERLREGERFLEYLKSNPEMMTLHGLTRYSMLVGLKNPLLKAVMLQNVDMLGELVKNTDFGHTDMQERINTSKSFIEEMRKHNLIRSDVSVDIQLHMLMAIAMGYLTIDRYLPEQFKLTDEERADLAAETVRRNFELRAPTSDELRETTIQFSEVIHTLYEIEKKGIDI